MGAPSRYRLSCSGPGGARAHPPIEPDEPEGLIAVRLRTVYAATPVRARA